MNTSSVEENDDLCGMAFIIIFVQFFIPEKQAEFWLNHPF